MPRAEVGSTKWQANQQKSKGLQRLRWYCQACEKQCRDENGFKCHTQSETHVRQMMLIGEDPRKVVNDYSQQFLNAFLRQLKQQHSTKAVQINWFYQSYIQDKEHIHMNATKWKSLTEFAKHLGREGLCRVEETEKGIHIAWIDNSPEALRRQAAIQKQERMERNDEEWEQRLLRQQVRRAQKEAWNGEQDEQDAQMQGRDLERRDGEKISFNFGTRQESKQPPTPPQSDGRRSSSERAEKEEASQEVAELSPPNEDKAVEALPAKAPMKMSLGGATGMNQKAKPRSMAALFGGAKKGGTASSKRPAEDEAPKKVSEAERVMREDMERSKAREFQGRKRPKLG